MTSFGWKRKAIEKISESQQVFSPEEIEEDDNAESELDWIALNKKRKLEALEDSRARFERLKKEGIGLAEEEKFWQAISRWTEALSLDSSDARLWEMKAQALVSLHEWTEAIEAAEKAVRLERSWWAGYQTLGRAQLGLGQLEQARISFQKAVHLNPEDEELRREDLDWVLGLLRHRDRTQCEELRREEQGEGGDTVLVKARVTARDLNL